MCTFVFDFAIMKKTSVSLISVRVCMFCVSDLFHIPHTIAISCALIHCNRKGSFNLSLGFSLHAFALTVNRIPMFFPNGKIYKTNSMVLVL